MPSLARIRRLSRQEVLWRVAAFGRVTRDRAVHALRPPRWDRETLWTSLAPHVQRPPAAGRSESSWLEVHRDLAATLRARPSRFIIDPDRIPEIRDAVLARWPGAAAEAAARAARIASGRYDLLGYRGLSFATGDGQVDWHADPVHGCRAPLSFWSDVPYLDQAIGDHKIIWELNRHQHWLGLARALWLTDDPRWGDLIVVQLKDWMRANPPLLGVNWASMLELGFRSLSWLSALHLLIGRDDVAPDEPWLVDLLIGLDRQLCHVERNLSHYFSPNTHLTGEALALYAVGTALPELAASTRWMDTGRAILLREIDRQIAADGGHVERATHYHRYTLDFYVLAALVAERNGDCEGAARFAAAVDRLARFMRAIADDAGRIPHIGDDDGGMLWPICAADDDDARASLTLASAVSGRPDVAPWPAPEEVFWLGWRTRPGCRPAAAPAPGSPGSQVFPDSGLVVMRDDDGHHLLFDVGPHGYLNGGHAHADALALTLSVRGVPFLIDPGTATYTVDPRLRDQLRSTASHNTVTVNRRSSSEPAGPFHWRTRADASLATWRANRGLSWAEASHAGYDAIVHRRTVVAARGHWVIVDELRGSGHCCTDAHWHFHPDWAVRCEDGHRLLATHEDGQSMWLLSDGGSLWLTYGDDEAGLGWSSPRYGTLVPAWTARVSRADMAPLTMTTWIGDARTTAIGRHLPTLEHVALERDDAAAGVGVRVTDGHATLFTAVRPGDSADREGRRTRIGAYSSDGRLLQYATTEGRLDWLALADATGAAADDALVVRADGRLTDLALAVNGERLVLQASAPRRLQLSGPAIRRVRGLVLNGREHDARRDPTGAIVIPAEAWGGDNAPSEGAPLAFGV